MDNSKPKVQLSGANGNAFVVIAACKKAARAAGRDEVWIDAIIDDMMSGDYNHLLAVALRNFDAS